MARIVTKSPEDTEQLGRGLAHQLNGGEMILLYAPLGAGKTVFTKGIAAGLGVSDTVTSPTFTIVSEYDGRLRLIHVDLYRINSEAEYEQLAIDETRMADSVVVVEWPERAGSLLPADGLRVTIDISPEGSRMVTVPDPVQ